jgi:general secretion pathway protein I
MKPPRSTSHGFTLVEVLAALLLIAIVLPVVMQGISLGAQASSNARHRTEAAGLAESKLSELVATREWQMGNLTGDFAPDWPDYRWEATVGAYVGDSSGQNVQELGVRVYWLSRNQENSVSLSTLTYARSSTSAE